MREPNETLENKFKFWLLDKTADLESSKITLKQFLVLVEEGAAKAYKLFYGEKK